MNPYGIPAGVSIPSPWVTGTVQASSAPQWATSTRLPLDTFIDRDILEATAGCQVGDVISLQLSRDIKALVGELRLLRETQMGRAALVVDKS